MVKRKSKSKPIEKRTNPVSEAFARAIVNGRTKTKKRKKKR